jgi:prophage regulatory protein
MSANSPERILRLKSVIERTGLSRSTVYRKVQASTFPKPLKISERCIGWRESDVETWLRSPVVHTGAKRRDALCPD